MQVFGRDWFLRHQRKLLFLLNNPFTRDWFRWKMRIDGGRSSVQGRDILAVEPNGIMWLDDITSDGKVNLSSEFRCRPKLSNRLFHEFNPLWKTMHKLDELFLDKYAPELSFGFNTLTAYPDAHTESTTVDGNITSGDGSAQTWTTLRNGYALSATPSVASDYIADINSKSNVGDWRYMIKGFFLFLTSGLTSDATISNAVFSVNCDYTVDNINSQYTHVVSSSPASNTDLATGDWGNVGSTSFASISTGSFSTSGYNDFTLDGNGKNNVSKTGISKFGTRIKSEIDNSEPANSGSYHMAGARCYFADQTGTSQDPKLVITYTLPTYPINIDGLSFRRRWH